jgi:hypothetical protein
MVRPSVTSLNPLQRCCAKLNRFALNPVGSRSRSCGHRWGERAPSVNVEHLCVKLGQLIQPFENQWHAPII